MKQETKHDGWDPYAFDSYIQYVEEAVMQDQVVMDHNTWTNNALTKQAYDYAVERKRIINEIREMEIEIDDEPKALKDYTYSEIEFYKHSTT